MAHCAKNDCYISCSFRKLYPDGPGRRRTRAFSVTRLLRAAADVAGTSRAAILVFLCITSRPGLRVEQVVVPVAVLAGRIRVWQRRSVEEVRRVISARACVRPRP